MNRKTHHGISLLLGILVFIGGMASLVVDGTSIFAVFMTLCGVGMVIEELYRWRSIRAR